MRHRAVIAPLVLLVAAGAAAGGERVHVVRPGDSASAIALRTYGDVDLGALILQYNGRDGTTLRIGEEIRLPYCEIHLVRSGDSWSRIAQRYLEAASRFRAIADLNGLDPSAPLRVGQRIAIPVAMPHPLRRGETLAGLAERYYGDARRGKLLEEFNRIEDPRRLPVGGTLHVPLVSLRLREEAHRERTGSSPQIARAAGPRPAAPPRKGKPEPSVAPGSDPVDRKPDGGPARPEAATPDPPAAEPPAPREAFAAEFGVAIAAFEAGDYEAARDLLESLRANVEAGAGDAERRRLLRLLAFVYVAFERAADACEAFGAAGGGELDPDLVSPKIRSTLAACPSS